MPEKIREELQNILKNEPNNYSKILELSNDLSKFDENNVRFSVDAGIINRLGMELVARHETAVSELVKNAYDADATKVKILFKNSSNTGGTLEIHDNGSGMTRNQLINGFMRLSSSEKMHFPLSSKYNRKRAGKKGIGRFSAQRLGKKLTIITQTVDVERALKITVDWDDFLGDKDLLSITNQISFTDKLQDEGTILIIEQLRDTWTKAQIERVYRYASEILQPFPLSKTKNHLKTTIDPGFKLNCIKIDNGKKETIADEQIMFFEHALAEISGKVDNEGNMFVTIKSKKLSYNEKTFLLNKDEPLKVLRNVSMKAYYFIYGESDIPKQVETLIREKSKDEGGIRLYRNGFRVLPYGESDDDWLGLDASMTRRTVLPSHRNVNFFGFIEVNNDYGEQFEEYFLSYASPALTQISRMNGRSPAYTLQETATRILGMFDFTGTMERSEKDSEGSTFSIEFAYKFTYEKPANQVLKFPVAIHNQLVDRRLVEHDTVDLSKKKKTFYSSSIKHMREWEVDNILDQLVLHDKYVRVPSYDDIIYDNCVSGTRTLFSAICSVDDNDPKHLLNLNDLGNYLFNEEILQFIKDEEWQYIYKPYQSFLHISHYRNSFLSHHESATVDKDLNFNTVTDLNKRVINRVRLSIAKNILDVDHRAIQRMLKYPEILKKLVLATETNRVHLERLRPRVDITHLFSDLPNIGAPRSLYDTTRVQTNTVLISGVASGTKDQVVRGTNTKLFNQIYGKHRI